MFGIQIDLDALAKLPAGARAQAESLLREYERAIAWNPMLAYRPASCAQLHPHALPGPGVCTDACKHAAFHTSRAASKWLFGGNRAGKTTTAICDDIIQATPRELLADRPDLLAFKKWECPFYCRVMAPDMQRTMIPVIHQKLRDWLPKALLKGGSFDKSYDKTGAILRLECGCRFDFLSYEMDLDKFGGAALHRCHYDEEPPGAIRRESLMRLIDFNGDEIGSMTPLKGLTWTYKEVVKAPPSPNVFWTQIGLAENPHVDAEARDRILNSISDPREREAREFGAFVHFGGLVYPEWRAALVRPRKLAELRGWEHVCSIDPGVRFCGLTFIAFDDDNRSHTWAAKKLADAIPGDYARAIRQHYALLGVPIDDVHFVIDPAARARSQVNAESVMDELAREGIYANAGQNDVNAGVTQLRRRIRTGWAEIADCERTLDLTEELEEYRQEVDPDKDDGQFKILKQHDHVCDAWRYGHMERPWLPDAVTGGAARPDKPAWWEVAGPPPPRTPAGSVMGWGA